MSNSNNSQSGGIGFIGLLTIVFITLKLTGHITWSWFWVLSPVIFTILFVLFLAAIMLWLEVSNKKKRL
jgi:hypothetical protein